MTKVDMNRNKYWAELVLTSALIIMFLLSCWNKWAYAFCMWLVIGPLLIRVTYKAVRRRKSRLSSSLFIYPFLSSLIAVFVWSFFLSLLGHMVIAKQLESNLLDATLENEGGIRGKGKKNKLIGEIESVAISLPDLFKKNPPAKDDKWIRFLLSSEGEKWANPAVAMTPTSVRDELEKISKMPSDIPHSATIKQASDNSVSTDTFLVLYAYGKFLDSDKKAEKEIEQLENNISELITERDWCFYSSGGFIPEAIPAFYASVFSGFSAPLRNQIAQRLIIGNGQKQWERLLIHTMLVDDASNSIQSRSQLSETEGKELMDAIESKLMLFKPSTQFVSVTMSILSGAFQWVTLALFCAVVVAVASYQRELDQEQQSIADMSNPPNSPLTEAELRNLQNMDGNDPLVTQILQQKIRTQPIIIGVLPKFADEIFWESKAPSTLAARTQFFATKFSNDFVPNVLNSFLQEISRNTVSVNDYTFQSNFLKRCREFANQRKSESHSAYESLLSTAITVIETIGFIGTLLGIVFAFGAIPAMQLPTDDKLLKAESMVTVTSGLVLAFSTTLVAQSAKLILIVLHRQCTLQINKLGDDFVAFVNDFIKKRNS